MQSAKGAKKPVRARAFIRVDKLLISGELSQDGSLWNCQIEENSFGSPALQEFGGIYLSPAYILLSLYHATQMLPVGPAYTTQNVNTKIKDLWFKLQESETE